MKTGHVRISGARAARPRVWLPAGLSFYDYPKPDDARHFVGTLARKHAIEDVDSHGFATLNWGVMRRLHSHDHLKATIDQLAAEGVIDIDKHYLRGSKSRGYRLTPEWLPRHAVPRELSDRWLVGRLARERERRQREQDGRRLPIHDQLEEWSRLVTLKPGVLIRLDELPPATRLGQSVLVQRIQLSDYYFNVSQYGRVFNPITGLERSLRQFMQIDGQPVGGFDISCAQPALLGLLVARLQPNPAYQTRIHNPCPVGLSAPAPLPSLPLPSPLPAVLPVELVRFLASVEVGSLYDELLPLLCLPDSAENLAWVKKRFLVDVLAKRRFSATGRRCDYLSLVEQSFRSLFPTLYDFIRAVNQNEHSTLIRSLQRLESWLVIEHVAPRLNVPVITLHDGLYFRQCDTEAVRQALHDAFAATGFRGTFKPC